MLSKKQNNRSNIRQFFMVENEAEAKECWLCFSSIKAFKAGQPRKNNGEIFVALKGKRHFLSEQAVGFQNGNYTAVHVST